MNENCFGDLEKSILVLILEKIKDNIDKIFQEKKIKFWLKQKKEN